MADETPPEQSEALMAMLKRRGFIQPAYEPYGGVAGFYDYGPLGQGLKRQFEALWRQHYVVEEGFGEISTPTVAPKEVFEASGHLDQFDDVLVECPECQAAFRADHFLEDEFDRIVSETRDAVDATLEKLSENAGKQLSQAAEFVLDHLKTNRARAEHEPRESVIRDFLSVPPKSGGASEISPIEETFGRFKVEFFPAKLWISDTETGEYVGTNEVRCRSCGEGLHERGLVSPFNLMFSTRIGPGSGKRGYIRPETAQGMFVNFDWLYRFHREHLPFGAVQIGRAYRNEISPRQGLIRLREFWQAEAEVFVDPDDKSHPGFEDVADTTVRLLPDGGEEHETTLGEAVEAGTIANEMVAYFVWRTQRVLTEAGIDGDRLRFRQHESDEMAHYAADCWDAEFESPRYGWVECVGIADRGCYDLESHQDHSNESFEAFRRYDEAIEQDVIRVEPDMSALGPAFKGQAGKVADALRALDAEDVDPDAPIDVEIDGETLTVEPDAFEVVEETERVTGERFLPHVIEPSYGIDRILYAVLEHNFDPSGERTQLSLPPWMAPIEVGVLPLLSKDGLPERAREFETELRRRGLTTQFDDGGSIGRRYARLDEAGTPFAVTVDHETLEEGTVTVRDRDSQEQVRVDLDEAADLLTALFEGEQTFADLELDRIE